MSKEISRLLEVCKDTLLFSLGDAKRCLKAMTPLELADLVSPGHNPECVYDDVAEEIDALVEEHGERKAIGDLLE